jgi:hypothetical protein
MPGTTKRAMRAMLDHRMLIGKVNGLRNFLNALRKKRQRNRHSRYMQRRDNQLPAPR